MVLDWGDSCYTQLSYDGWATFMQRLFVICLHGVNAVSLTCTDKDFGGGHREASAIVAVMPTWWFVLPSVHWSVDRRLPGRSVGDNKWAFVCYPLCDVCVSWWWWDWKVECNPYEQAVTRYHVVGGREHNGHLNVKVNNINPCLCCLFTTSFGPMTLKNHNTVRSLQRQIVQHDHSFQVNTTDIMVTCDFWWRDVHHINLFCPTFIVNCD